MREANLTIRAQNAKLLDVATQDWTELLARVHARDPETLQRAVELGSTHNLLLFADVEPHVVVKEFRVKHGDELEREWAALRFLAKSDLDKSPVPLARSDQGIVMTRVPGEALADRIADPDYWPALAAALRPLYALRPGHEMKLVRAHPSTAESSTLIERLAAELEPLKIPGLAEWLRSGCLGQLIHAPSESLVPGDGFRQNFLEDAGSIGRVDFEDAGRGDWVGDLAGTVEHAHAAGLNADWDQLLEHFNPNDDERRRFRIARTDHAIWWLRTYWQRNDDECDPQRSRVCELLRSAPS